MVKPVGADIPVRYERADADSYMCRHGVRISTPRSTRIRRTGHVVAATRSGLVSAMVHVRLAVLVDDRSVSGHIPLCGR
jgi:hypothetical protein